MDIRALPEILKRYDVDDRTWAQIQESTRFRHLLANAAEEWHSALNTPQRIKIKSATMVELWLEHANELLHGTDTIAGKTELAKFLARLAEVGLTGARVEGGGGERFSLTINLGADHQLKIEKELPARVIEHDPPTQET